MLCGFCCRQKKGTRMSHKTLYAKYRLYSKIKCIYYTRTYYCEGTGGKVYLSDMRKGNLCQLRFGRALGMVNQNGTTNHLDRRINLRVCAFEVPPSGTVFFKESRTSFDQRTLFTITTTTTTVINCLCVCVLSA